MDLRKIKKLIDMLEESNLAELEIKEGEEAVRLSRMPKGSMRRTQCCMPRGALQSTPSRGAPQRRRGSPTASPPSGHGLPPGHVVRSPMVGTFYARPSRNRRRS